MSSIRRNRDSDRDRHLSGRRLTTLPRTQFSGLDFDNIIQDITELVTQNPEYNENWDDFLSSNAGRMLVELFAYISDQLATRIDWVVNENFISTATQKKSIIRILKLIGYNLDLPYAAEVPVNITFDRPIGDYEISGVYDANTADLEIFSLTAQSRSGGERKTFEIIEYDETNERYEYKSPIELKTGTLEHPSLFHENVKFFEGRTFIETISVDTNNSFVYTLPQAPVIQHSPRVYKIRRGASKVEEEELLQVESFLDPRAQRDFDLLGNENPIPYIVNVLEDNRVSIEFGPASLLGQSRRPRVNDEIRIFYRVGGGVNGNITRRSINTTRRFNINNRNVNISFVNETQGSGGEEAETPEYASIFGPLQIRTAQKAVTEEDYEILISGLSSVIKSQAYGNNNIPSNLRNLYGITIRPLEVWNYVLEDKPGWQDVDPSRYNEFEWIQLRLENRFNEVYSFRDGSFNNSTTSFLQELSAEREVECKEEKYINAKNSFFIETDDELKENIYKDEDHEELNPDLKLRITSQSIDDNYFRLSKENNIFNHKFELNMDGTLSPTEDCIYIRQDQNAYFISQENIVNNINMETNKYVKIGFDNREPIEIDLSDGAEDTSQVTEIEIRDKINEVFKNSSYYNDGQENTEKPSQELGMQISDMNDNISEFSLNTDYYFKVNGIYYKINSGEEIDGPTYNELKEKLQEEFSFNIRLNFRNQQYVAEITDGEEYLPFIKKGMRLATYDGSLISSTQTKITDVNWLEREITFDSPDAPTRNENELLCKVYFYDVEEVEDGGYSDIKIVNCQEEPYGPIWVQEAQEVHESNNLFSVLGIEPESFIPLNGAKGKQKLGINGVINETRGFKAFQENDDDNLDADDTNYSFRVLLNEGSENESEENIIISLNNTDTLESIKNKIDDEFSSKNVEASVKVDEYNRIRITSDLYGSESSVEIIEYTEGGSTYLGNLLNGTIEGVQGRDETKLELDAGEYSFKINYHTYKVNISEDDTFIILKDKIQDAIGPQGFTIDLLEEEWFDNFEVTFENADRVVFEDIDLFSSLEIKRLNEYEVENEKWEDFETPIGGGDYSYVAELFEVIPEEQTEEYLFIKSPCTTKEASIVSFYQPDSYNISSEVFGLNFANVNSHNAYGYKQATLILKHDEDDPDDRFGDILLEIGSLNFYGQNSYSTYYHYIYSDKDEIPIGRYYTDNFDRRITNRNGDEIDHPAYREPALRVYNTQYDENIGEIDLNRSNFEIRMTKDRTDEMSIYAIESDWSFQPSVAANIETNQNPEEIVVNEDKYLINVNIDNIQSIEIDVTGDEGEAGTYSISEIIDNINQRFRNEDAYSVTPLYQTFNYATLSDSENSIIIRSPINSNNSSVKFTQPSNTDKDATNVLFGLALYDDYEHEINAFGDYFIAQHEYHFEARLDFEDNWLKNISEEAMQEIEVGHRIFSIPGVIASSYVLQKDEENNRIMITNIATDEGTLQLTSSNNSMVLHKMYREDGESELPDLDFYFHFINDRRYVEDIFDGREITNEEAGVTISTPGYPMGSLDEDVLDSFLLDKKIVGVNHIFKQTRFKTFDIRATIYYESTFSRTDISSRVENSLRDAFSLENRSYGEIVPRSRILSIIHENAGVDYVEIEYFGEDATDSDTNKDNILEARFDEIITLSENRFIAGVQTHGLIFSYSISGVS